MGNSKVINVLIAVASPALVLYNVKCARRFVL